MNFLEKIFFKKDPQVYLLHDQRLNKTLRLRDLLGLGIGLIVSTSIFTLPGAVAALHTGPSVIIVFVLSALMMGVFALIYAEMASAMPFAGSAYSWINVLFGELPGWIVGWALLAEYVIALAFIASGLSANLRPLLSQIGISLPNSLSYPLGVNNGIIDLIALLSILFATLLVSFNVKTAAKMDNILVIMKLLAILVFIIIGMFYVKKNHFIPFIPHYRVTKHGAFGGWQGIYSGLATAFISYLGFDAITSNAAEVKNPQRNLPLGVLGSLGIASMFFVVVSIVLIGLVPYRYYLNSAEPFGIALRAIHHPIIADCIQIIAVIGMFTALIGLTMASSRLIYSFGRDEMIPNFFGKLNKKHNPMNALLISTIIAILLGSFFSFTFLSQLDTAGALVAFMFVSIAMFKLRKFEGNKVFVPGFKLPYYKFISTLGIFISLLILYGINYQAKLLTLIWFILGISIYFIYGFWHTNN